MAETALITVEDLLREAPDYNRFLNSMNGSENWWHWPSEIGKGSMYHMKLKPGLILAIGEFLLSEKITINFENKGGLFGETTNPVIFYYGLSGNTRYALDFKGGREELCFSKPGHSSIVYMPEWTGIMTPPTGKSVSWLSIFIDPQLLNTYRQAQENEFPKDLCDIAAGAEDNPFYQMSAAGLAIDMAIRQMLDCPYQGFLKCLYLESKALELITHSLARLACPENGKKKPFILRPQDIERVIHARELIQRDLQNPPKLLDLAKIVGLPHPKLNFGFREIFGTTFFDYLRQMRLNKAKSLLDDGRMNVTEAANAVGYSSLSHFAKSFKEYHGISPSAYLRIAPQKW